MPCSFNQRGSKSGGPAAAHPAGLGGAAAETLQEHGRAALGSDAAELSGHRAPPRGLGNHVVGIGSCERGTERGMDGMESFDVPCGKLT